MDPNLNWRTLRFSDGEVKFVPRVDLFTSGDIYNCVIDPTQNTDITLHRYKNLTELLAREVWPASTVLHVGVYQPTNSIITEPANTVSAVGNGDLALHGILSPDAGNLGGWEWAAISVSLGQQIMLSGLCIAPSTRVPTVLMSGTGSLHLEECYVGGSSAPTALIAAVSGAGCSARDCYFDTALNLASGGGIQITNEFFNCVLTGLLTVGALYVVKWHGGKLNTITTGGTASVTISAEIESNVTIGSGGSSAISIHNTSGVGGNLAVSCIGAPVDVTGEWGTVQFTGTSTFKRSFKGSCSNSPGLDFTGPGEVEINQTFQSFSSRVTLRGTNVHARVMTHLFSSPAIDFIACSHSLATVVFKDQGAGTKPYAFDATSNNNILIISGVNQAGVTTPGTDAGANNRVITETTLGAIALTDAHIFVGNSSNIATDVAMTGDITITNAGVTVIGALRVATGMLQASAVTLAKMANLAANSIIGNNTVSAATPIALSVAQTKALLAITEADVASLVGDLALKAPLASPTFTGTPAAPTAGVGTNTTQLATTAFVIANALSSDVDDSTFRIHDNGDNTKKIAFEASTVATGTTRTLTAPNASGVILLDGNIGVTIQAFDSDLNTIAGLTATTDNFIQSKASAWASRTVAQVTADIAPVMFPAWTNYTPTATQVGTLGATISHAKFLLVGKTMFVSLAISNTANAGTAGTSVKVGLPTSTDSPNGYQPDMTAVANAVGSGQINGFGTGNYGIVGVRYTSGTTAPLVDFLRGDINTVANAMGADPNAAIGTGATIRMFACYPVL